MTLGIDIGCGALLQVVLDDWIRGACFHGDTVAVGTYSGTVLVSDMRTGELLHVFTGHDGVSMNSRMLSNGAILSECSCRPCSLQTRALAAFLTAAQRNPRRESAISRGGERVLSIAFGA
eukprot:2534343-Rhodomonas_salina.5